MALIVCIDCEREISNRAQACPHCGCPVLQAPPTSSDRQNISILITATKQNFLVSTTIKVFLDDIEVGWLGDGQSLTITAPKGENTLKFKAAFRRCNVTFDACNDVMVNLKWNRFSGALEALCTGSDIRRLS